MSFSGSRTVRQASPARRGGVALVGLWTAQVALAGMFLLAGSSKLAGAPQMVALFNAIGIGQWFRYVTGFIEVASAVTLLWPTLAPFGAMALVVTMICAVGTQLFIVGGSPALPVALLLGSALVPWARRDQLRRVLSRTE